MTSDEAFANLVALTRMSEQDWRDVLSLPPDGQAVVLQAYKDQDWVKSADALAVVITVLGIVGQIAGVVGGVAGAATAISALKSL